MFSKYTEDMSRLWCHHRNIETERKVMPLTRTKPKKKLGDKISFRIDERARMNGYDLARVIRNGRVTSFFVDKKGGDYRIVYYSAHSDSIYSFSEAPLNNIKKDDLNTVVKTLIRMEDEKRINFRRKDASRREAFIEW